MKEELEELFAYMDAPDIEIALPSDVSEERIIHRVMEQIRPASQGKRTKPRYYVIAIAAALALEDDLLPAAERLIETFRRLEAENAPAAAAARAAWDAAYGQAQSAVPQQVVPAEASAPSLIFIL